MFCDKFLNLLTKNSLEVEKNKKKAEVTKIVLIRKFISNCLIINADNKNDIIKNMVIYNLSLKSDLTQLRFGPIAIATKNGIKKGNMSLL